MVKGHSNGSGLNDGYTRLFSTTGLIAAVQKVVELFGCWGKLNKCLYLCSHVIAVSVVDSLTWLVSLTRSHFLDLLEMLTNTLQLTRIELWKRISLEIACETLVVQVPLATLYLSFPWNRERRGPCVRIVQQEFTTHI